MNDNVTQIEAKTLYFETIDGQHILPASVTKRAIARFIDLISYGLIGSIFLIIFYGNVQTNGPEFSVELYDWMFVVGVSATILSTLFFAFIYPLFINKKNIGQTLGKQIFNITPMYLNKKYNPKLDIVKRELPLAIFYVFINIIVLLSGVNFISITNLYNDFLQSASENPELISNWKFVSSADTIIGANGFQQAMGYTYIILSPLFFTIIVVFLLSIAFGKKKRGLHDLYAKTAIVDLSTMGIIGSYKPVEEEVIPSESTDIVELTNTDNQSEETSSYLTIASFEFEEQKDGVENNKEKTEEINNNQEVKDDNETVQLTDDDEEEKKEENKI